MVATREAAVTTASLSTADRSSQFVTMTQWAPRTGRTKVRRVGALATPDLHRDAHLVQGAAATAAYA